MVPSEWDVMWYATKGGAALHDPASLLVVQVSTRSAKMVVW